MTKDASKLNEISQWFYSAHEPYAGGFFECPKRSRFFRFALAQRRYWENTPLPAYDGGKLYPCGSKTNDSFAVRPDYSSTIYVDWSLLEEKGKFGFEQLQKEMELLPSMKTPHTVGGGGYTHSIPNYGRIVREGLDSYRKRVQMLPQGDFKDGLLEVLEGIRLYHEHALNILKTSNAPDALIKAFERVPFLPAQNLYEALVAWNFIYYIDGCDNPGRMDADLIAFYNGENVEDILREFFVHVDINNGWSSALGPDCNALTLQCLHAIHGLRRPSLELRVTNNTPTEIWDAAIASLMSGCGQPAFYCEEAYQSALLERFPEIPKVDLLRFNGGGCTETMLAGLSNVGSLDAGINLPLIFSKWMRAHLQYKPNFETFYQGLIAEINLDIAEVLDILNEYRKNRAAIRPQPVRTLLIDDCIERELDFNAGGARYNWSVINVAGLVNVIDSLLAIKALVYDRQEYSAIDFIEKLDTQETSFLNHLRTCPCFGVDDEKADNLASDFSQQVFAAFEQRTPYLGSAFLPSSIQFATYTDAGKGIPATPDGRAFGEPLADSIGAIHGKDTKGPTALLNSAAKLNQKMALGTSVLNLRVQKQHIKQSLQALIMGYFEKGGMQVQVSCISRDEMLDALVNPQKHENLIVRIGGYSEYFNRLSPELKETVLNRTEFGA